MMIKKLRTYSTSCKLRENCVTFSSQHGMLHNPTFIVDHTFGAVVSVVGNNQGKSLLASFSSVVEVLLHESHLMSSLQPKCKQVSLIYWNRCKFHNQGIAIEDENLRKAKFPCFKYRAFQIHFSTL